jgi:hypothetical protein
MSDDMPQKGAKPKNYVEEARPMEVTMKTFAVVLSLVAGLFVSGLALGQSGAEAPSSVSQDTDAELAQELSNPVADLVTIPVQMNYDREIGPRDDGWKLQTNIQPVVPFHLNEDWNLISRTIMPVIYQDDIFPGAGSQFGLGDINLSLFFSPKRPTSGGLIWGVGPVLLFPTATDELLGTEKWGAGPTAVGLTMRGPWTLGMLANHVWSYAGDSDRQDVSSTFLQPFVAYTWPSAWTVSVQTESTYNWETENWSVPVNVAVSKLVRLGKLPVSWQAGVGYWAESPENGPEGFRFRLQANFVLPK